MGSSFLTLERLRRGKRPKDSKMIWFRIALIFVLLTITLAMPADDLNMQIYRQCKKTFGTKNPTKPCGSSRDCRISIKGKDKMCPEHDCLKDSRGKMKCSWQIFRN